VLCAKAAGVNEGVGCVEGGLSLEIYIPLKEFRAVVGESDVENGIVEQVWVCDACCSSDLFGLGFEGGV
jgi:hypothetical protein